MDTCHSCGRENLQPGAAYCLYCGAPLRSAPLSTPSEAYPTRYLKALEKVERLGTIIVVLSAVALVLVLI